MQLNTLLGPNDHPIIVSAKDSGNLIAAWDLNFSDNDEIVARKFKLDQANSQLVVVGNEVTLVNAVDDRPISLMGGANLNNFNSFFIVYNNTYNVFKVKFFDSNNLSELSSGIKVGDITSSNVIVGISPKDGRFGMFWDELTGSNSIRVGKFSFQPLPDANMPVILTSPQYNESIQSTYLIEKQSVFDLKTEGKYELGQQAIYNTTIQGIYDKSKEGIYDKSTQSVFDPRTSKQLPNYIIWTWAGFSIAASIFGVIKGLHWCGKFCRKNKQDQILKVEPLLDSALKATPIAIASEPFRLAKEVKLKDSSIYYDYGSGKKLTSWIDSNDYILCLKKNGMPIIVFTSLPETKDLTSDFAALLRLAGKESLEDLRINQYDSIYSELAIWKDNNQNGQEDVSEVISLEEAGIVELNFRNIDELNNVYLPEDTETIQNVAEVLWQNGEVTLMSDNIFEYAS